MLRYAAAAATALMLLAGVSACGGQDPPVAKPRPTRTATSPAPSPSPTPPALPAAAKANTKAGAKAFVRHFISTMNFAGTHGTTRPFRSLYGRSCGRCEGIADGIDRTYKRGGYIRGGTWRIDSLKIYGSSGGLTYVDAFVTYGPQEFRARTHSEVKRFPGREHQLQALQLRRANGVWSVAYLNPEA